MDVTRRCDYACRILRAAYKSGDSYVSVSDIAEQEDIPYAFARSIQHITPRRMASSKSTRWPSKSGPSTHACRYSSPTFTRQPPHMPVPSIMRGFMLTYVLMP